jgi:hypothetical protein
MDPLGDPEEVRSAVDHCPADVHTRPPPVGDERSEHLGHASAARRGVHVPDHAPVEQLARLSSRAHEGVEPICGEDGLESLYR